MTSESTKASRDVAMLAATALAMAVDAASAAEAESGPAAPVSAGARARRGRGIRRATPRRRPARHLAGPNVRASARVAPAAPARSQSETPAPDTQSELRDWIKDNATLMSNASLLISISALAIGILPTAGFLNPYIQALMFGAALLLLIELHHQWPEDLQLRMFRKTALPKTHSWRMTAFAVLLQIATVLFALWAALNTPIILLPLTALAIIVAFRLWYFPRFDSAVARVIGIAFMIAVLVVGELVMVVVWATVANETITIELGTGEPPTFDLGS